jgi:hypothetical protein
VRGSELQVLVQLIAITMRHLRIELLQHAVSLLPGRKST